MARSRSSEYIAFPHVNACVILRRNNFDPPHFLSTGDNLRGSAFRLLCQESDSAMRPPPAQGASPPGHSVVDGWRRDERTRGTPQSHLRVLVSSAKPTTGVQVVRAFRPRCLDSLTPGAHRAGPLHPRWAVCAAAQRQRLSRQDEITRAPMGLAPAYF